MTAPFWLGACSSMDCRPIDYGGYLHGSVPHDGFPFNHNPETQQDLITGNLFLCSNGRVTVDAKLGIQLDPSKLVGRDPYGILEVKVHR